MFIERYSSDTNTVNSTVGHTVTTKHGIHCKKSDLEHLVVRVIECAGVSKVYIVWLACLYQSFLSVVSFVALLMQNPTRCVPQQNEDPLAFMCFIVFPILSNMAEIQVGRTAGQWQGSILWGCPRWRSEPWRSLGNSLGNSPDQCTAMLGRWAIAQESVWCWCCADARQDDACGDTTGVIFDQLEAAQVVNRQKRKHYRSVTAVLGQQSTGWHKFREQRL